MTCFDLILINFSTLFRTPGILHGVFIYGFFYEKFQILSTRHTGQNTVLSVQMFHMEQEHGVIVACAFCLLHTKWISYRNDASRNIFSLFSHESFLPGSLKYIYIYFFLYNRSPSYPMTFYIITSEGTGI